MGEYIKRDALFEKVLEEKRFVFQMEDLFNNELIVQTVYKDFAEFVNSIPSADVTHVVHGRWEKTKILSQSYYGLLDGWECSRCGYSFQDKNKVQRYPKFMKFCPNCGARMDGE